MYNETIVSQLDNLKYLTALKNSNVTVISKKNKFGDVVKYFAQINKDDVIQKITYKASGCSHFVVFCNYFCSIVEGKTVKAALKINSEDLQKFAPIDESRIHVVDIILGTFALLIKKYRKGVEKGVISPCDVESIETKSDETIKKNKSSKKNENINSSLEDILTKKSQVSKKTNSKIKKDDEHSKDADKNLDKSKSIKMKEVKTKTQNNDINKNIVDSEETIPNAEKTVKQAGNILALQSMVTTSKQAKKEPAKIEDNQNHQEKNVKNLSKMLNKINKPTETHNVTDASKDKDLSSIKNGLSSMHESKMKSHDEHIKDTAIKSQEMNNNDNPEIEKTETKKKKGLFSWLKKNK